MPLRAFANSLLLCWLYLLNVELSSANDEYDPTPLLEEWSTAQTCLPYAWKDYYITITAAHAHDNVLFEVEDIGFISTGYKLDSLSIHVFKDEIPVDRETSLFSTHATHGIYEIGINSFDIKEAKYYLSVKCGPVATDFKVRIHEFPGEFHGDGDHIEGQLCPGLWAYHKFQLDDAEVHNTPHVRATFSGFHEHLYTLAHEDDPPLHLVNPYFLISPDDHHSTLTLCNVDAGHDYYIGVKGYQECVEYTVTLDYLTDADFASGECEEEHAEEIEGHEGLYALEVGHFSKFRGEAWAEYDFYLHVDAALANDNLVVEVEDMAAELNSQGLRVSLYQGSIPANRVSQFVADFTHDKMYSLAVNLYDLVEGDYYVSVQVMNVDTDFRVLARLIHGQLHLGDHVNGVVCPGELIYHYFDHLDYSSSESTVTESHHKWRSVLAEEDSAEASILSHPPYNVRFKLSLHSGDMTYTTSHLHPSLKMVPPYQHISYEEQHLQNYSYTNIDICNMEHGYHYLSVQGGDSCSEYELRLEEIEIGECTELEHECLESCAVMCDVLEFGHFHYDNCEPNEWKDYMFVVDHSSLENNLIVEVDTAFGNDITMDFEAIGLYMFYNELPTDRRTDIYNKFSAEMTWSVAINSHDLLEGDYFFSVKCGMNPVKFRVLGELTKAHMYHEDRISGMVCPGEMVYHYIEVGDSNTSAPSSSGHKLLASSSSSATNYGHAHFTISVHSGDIYYQERHEHPPIKLIPPFRTTSYLQQMSAHSHGDEVSICNMEAGTHYIAISGGTACSHYEVTLHHDEDYHQECHEIEQELEAMGDYHAGMHHLSPGHSMIGSCEANSYTDYYLNITHADAESNFVIEVHDTLTSIDPTALTLSIYYGSIPSDRKTQFYSDFSNDHIFSVSVNVWDLKEGEYFVSVKCGARPVSYTVIPELFNAHLVDGGHVAGEVCPGNFVFHYIEVPALEDGTSHHLGHVVYTLKLYEGNVRYKVQHGEPALKIVPPYGTAYSSVHLLGENSTIETCDVDHGYWYITLRAMESCSEYDLYVNVVDNEEECHGVHSEETESTSSVQELHDGYYSYDSCEAFGNVDFYMHVESEIKENMLLEVEDLSDGVLDTQALSIYLYEDEIPSNRLTEYKSEYSSSGIWTISVSSHDIHDGDYMLSVKCGPNPKRFRVLGLMIQAQLHDEEWVNGEICPGDWVHHYLDVLDMQVSGALEGVSSSVEFDVDLHNGNLYYLLRTDHAPTRMSPPYMFADATAHETLFHTSFCYIENYPSAHKYYLSLNGGTECAHYSIRARVVNVCEHQFHHDSSLVTSSVNQLEMGKFSYATCQPYSFFDYTFSIPAENAGSNLILEVEDLGDNLNPNSLVVDLYLSGRTSIPTTRNSDYTETSSRNKIFSIALSSIQTSEGTYFASVRCAHETVRYRMAVNYVSAEVEDHQYMHGQVSPGDWTYHYYHKPAGATKSHVRFFLEVVSGDVYMAMMRKDYPPGFSIRKKNHFMKAFDETELTASGQALMVVDFCNAPEDTDIYFGIHGGDYVAEYVLYIQAYNDGDENSLIHGNVLPSDVHSTCDDFVADQEGYVLSAASSLRTTILALAISTMVVIFLMK